MVRTIKIPAKVDNFYKALAKKYFYTITFVVNEAANALQLGIQIDEHLGSEETRQRAIKTGNYEPYHFDFKGVKVSHNKMETLILCYRVINHGEFVGSIHALHKALPFEHKGLSTFTKHVGFLLNIGWLEVEYIAIDPSKPVGRGNIHGRFTMPSIADDIVNHIVATGYRL